MENPAIVFPSEHEVRIEDGKRPTPEASEVMIETRRSLVSTGTELTIYSGDYPEGSKWDAYGEFPFRPGYANVGVVRAVGEAVDDEWIGATVATRTPHARYVTADVDGPMTRVPDSVPAEEATFFALAGVAMNGVRRGEVEWGDDVAIYGAGLVGQLAARFCLLAGARTVIVFDLLGARLDLLPDAPAITTADPTAVDPADHVHEATDGRLADVVVEVTGDPNAIVDQFDALRERGRLVVLSSPRGETRIDLHDHCNYPSYEIVGAHDLSHPPTRSRGMEHDTADWTYERHYGLFLELLADDRLAVADLISHRIGFDDAPKMYEKLYEDRSDAMGVVIEWT